MHHSTRPSRLTAALVLKLECTYFFLRAVFLWAVSDGGYKRHGASGAAQLFYLHRFSHPVQLRHADRPLVPDRIERPMLFCTQPWSFTMTRSLKLWPHQKENSKRKETKQIQHLFSNISINLNRGSGRPETSFISAITSDLKFQQNPSRTNYIHTWTNKSSG